MPLGDWFLIVTTHCQTKTKNLFWWHGGGDMYNQNVLRCADCEFVLDCLWCFRKWQITIDANDLAVVESSTVTL